MTKKDKRTTRNPRCLAAQGLRLVIDGKPDDTIRANGSDIVGTGHDKRGRGLEPVGRVVFRLVNNLRKMQH